MQIPVFQFMLFFQEKIAEESHQIFDSSVNVVFRVVEIRPYESIAEIAGMLGEQVIIDIKT
jgi:hypothetical protein